MFLFVMLLLLQCSVSLSQSDIADQGDAWNDRYGVLRDLLGDDKNPNMKLALKQMELLINEAEAQATQSRLDFTAMQKVRGRTVSELEFKKAEEKLGYDMKRLQQLIELRDVIEKQKEMRDSLLAQSNELDLSNGTSWLERVIPDPNADNLDFELEKAIALIDSMEHKKRLSLILLRTAEESFAKAAVGSLEVEKAKTDVALIDRELQFARTLCDEIKKQKKLRKPQATSTTINRSDSASLSLMNSLGLQKSDLNDCSMHVVGIYSPQASNRDSTNEVFVTVKGLDKPSIIVLSAYSSTFWRVRFEQPENIKLVIVTGYYAQRASIDSNSLKIPLVVSSYFNETSTPSANNPWGYATSWKSEQGWRLANMLYELTGRTASTFIGMDHARTITIDGKKGVLSVRDAKEPIPGLLTEQEIKENPIPFETDEWNVNRSSADRENANLEEVEQSLKQLILETESKVKSSKSAFDDLENEIEKLLRDVTDAAALDRTKAKALFNKRFELQVENQNLRGEIAKLKLKLIASQQRKRLQNRDSIIEQEIDEALEKAKADRLDD
jgi:hypothetical protein